MTDVCVMLKDAVANRTAATVLKEAGISCLVCDDLSVGILRQTFGAEEPKVALCGAWILRARVEPEDLEAFKAVVAHYHPSYRGRRLPVVVLYHAEDRQVPRVAEIGRIAYVARLPEAARTADWKATLLGVLRRIDEEAGLGLEAFHRREEAPQEEGPRYSDAEFKAEYSMQAHRLVLTGPLVGRAPGRIEAVLKNEKVHQDVKANGPRDRNGRRILVVDWSGVNAVSEKAEQHTFVVFKELMRNGVYEVVRFEGFLEKEPLFANKTHFELFVNRFCPQEEG